MNHGLSRGVFTEVSEGNEEWASPSLPSLPSVRNRGAGLSWSLSLSALGPRAQISTKSVQATARGRFCSMSRVLGALCLTFFVRRSESNESQDMKSRQRLLYVSIALNILASAVILHQTASRGHVLPTAESGLNAVRSTYFYCKGVDCGTRTEPWRFIRLETD
jgi:hypothetical protein